MSRAIAARLFNPFPGLRPFRSDEHHLFFGREDQTAALLQLLRRNRFLAVVGTSGSGKSSLVRAGLIAALHGGTMTQAGSTWEVVVLRPGGNPVENLARALLDAELYAAADPDSLPRLLATLNRSRFGLVEAAKQSDVLASDANLLVVVDQFEELFRFRQQDVGSEEEAAAFVNLLLTASQQAERAIYIALTMRSDYLGDCSEIPGLAEAVNDGEYLIPRLLRDQKRDAIEKPVGVGGARISPLLVQRLLNDVGDDPDQLPVLQHALMRMWHVWCTTGDASRPIGFDDFEAIGGLEAALSNHADEIFESLPDERHRRVCERIFKTLTEKGADNRGIRRPTRFAKLAAIAGEEPHTVATVLDAYRQSGVTFLMPGTEQKLAPPTVIDLSHESLMRGWRRLRGWVEQEAQSARIFRRLSDTASLWRDGKAGLFRDPDLQIALSWRTEELPNADWADLYGGDFGHAIQFLEQSAAAVEADRQARETARLRELEQARKLAETERLRAEEQQSTAQRLQRLVGALAAAAVIAVLAFLMALSARNQAQSLADKNKKLARESRLKEEQAVAAAALAKEKEELAVSAEEKTKDMKYATDMEFLGKWQADEQYSTREVANRLMDHVPTPGSGLTETRDRRDFEWYAMRYRLDHSSLAIAGVKESIVDLAVAHGQVIGLDKSARIFRWNIDTGERVSDPVELNLDGRLVRGMALSSDGRRAAVLFPTAEVHVYDTANGETLNNIPASGSSSGMWLRFSLDGRYLVVLNYRSVAWYEADTGNLVASLNDDSIRGNNRAFGISLDGLTIAVGQVSRSGGDEIATFLVDLDQKKIARRLWNPNLGTLGVLAFTPGGESLVFGNYFGNTLRTVPIQLDSAKDVPELAHADSLSAIRVTSQGLWATGGSDGTIKVWTGFDPPKLRTMLRGHRDRIVHLTFSPDAGKLVSVGVDKSLRVWDLTNPPTGRRVLDEPASHPAAYSPDGLFMATRITREGRPTVGLWDVATGRLARVLSADDDQGRPDSLAFSPDGQTLAVGWGGGKGISHVALWDLDSATRLAILPGTTDLPDVVTEGGNGDIHALAFSPDGQLLVCGFGANNRFNGDAHPLKVWDVATRSLLRRLEGHQGACLSLAFSPGQPWLASASYDGTVRIWNTTTWRVEHILKNPDPPTDSGSGRFSSVAFAPNGRYLAAGSHDANVVVWELPSWQPAAVLKGHKDMVHCVAFSPRGGTLATGSRDLTIRLWNLAAWREVLRLELSRSQIGLPYTLAFSPGGNRLRVDGDDVVEWMAEPDLWDDPGKGAGQLAGLLDSDVDFRSRFRLLSTSLDVHRALELLREQRPNEPRVAAAWAAARAHWFAARQQWAEAVHEVDQLRDAAQGDLRDWLRTPGLLRVAHALLEQGRVADATMLLRGGKRQRDEDGLTPIIARCNSGFAWNDNKRITAVRPGSEAEMKGLRVGDRLVRLNDFDLTEGGVRHRYLMGMVAGRGPGESIRLRVEHSDGQQDELVLPTDEQIFDVEADQTVDRLWAAINQRLAEEPSNPELLELRAELAGQWAGFAAQVNDYTAAIQARSALTKPTEGEALRRLFRRRGDAHLALEHWQLAVDDYSRADVDSSRDDRLMSNATLAQANLLGDEQSREMWNVSTPVALTSEQGATLRQQADGSIRVSGTYPETDLYTVDLETDLPRVTAVRLEALVDPDLPKKGPGRHGEGLFVLDEFRLSTIKPGAAAVPTPVPFGKAWADHHFVDVPITPTGKWHYQGGQGESHRAVYELETPIENPSGSRLRFTLKFDHGFRFPGLQLGHFRLSVTADPDAIEWERAHPLKRDPWIRLAAAYRSQDKQSAIDQLVARRPSSAAGIGDLFAADRQWQRAIEIYSQAIGPEQFDLEALQARARAYEQLQDWDRASADWLRVAGPDLAGARLRAEFARRLEQAEATADAVPTGTQTSLQHRIQLAATHRGAAAQILRAELERYPGNWQIAQQLSEMLASARPGRWTSVRPVSLSTKFDDKLKAEPDGTIVVVTANNVFAQQTYDIEVEVDCPRVSALKFEFSPRSSENRSNIAYLRAVRVFRQKDSQGVPTGRIAIADAATRSDNFNRSFSLQSTFRDDNSYSSLRFGFGFRSQNREAIYQFESPVDTTNGRRFVVQIECANLDRVRVSAAGDANEFRHTRQQYACSSPANPLVGLAGAYVLDGDTKSATALFAECWQQARDVAIREDIVERAGRFDGILAELRQRFSDDPLLALAVARQTTLQGQELLAQGKDSEAQRSFESAAAILDQVDTRHPPTDWVVSRPSDASSLGGAELTAQEDGSILAAGKNPDTDVYSVTLRPSRFPVTALRLQALPDAPPPNGRYSRAENGMVKLTGVRICRTSTKIEGGLEPLPIGSAWVSSGQNLLAGGVAEDQRALLDKDDRSGWVLSRVTNEPAIAILQLEEPLGPSDATELVVQLSFQDERYPKCTLNRFHLALASSPDVVATAEVRKGWSVAERVETELSRAKALWQQRKADEATRSFVRALDLATDKAVRSRVGDAIAADDTTFATLRRMRSDDWSLLVAYGQRQALHGEWEKAAAAYAQAVDLAGEAAPKWITRFWTVGSYPYDIETSYPPELNPDPRQPVSSSAETGGDSAEKLAWQPAIPSDDDRISLDVLPYTCNYVLGRIWSPAQREVALLLGDDDALKVFVNGELQLTAAENSGQARPGEHYAAVTLAQGWNTVLCKVQNRIGLSAIYFSVSEAADDLKLARMSTACFQAVQRAATGRAEESLVQLGQLIKQHPYRDEPFAARAAVYQQLSRWEDAIVDWSKAIDLWSRSGLNRPDSREYFVQRATTYRQLKQYRKAIDDLSRVWSPGTDTTLQCAADYEALGELDKSLAEIERAVRLFDSISLPRDERRRLLLKRGELYARKQKWKEAAADFEQASGIAVTPTQSADFALWRDLALLQLQPGNLEALPVALAKLDEFVTSDPANADRNLWRAYVWVAKPELLDAQRSAQLLQSLEEPLSPNHAAWQTGVIAGLHHRAGRHQEAADRLERWLREYPESEYRPAMQLLAALAHHQGGHVELAQKRWDEANAWMAQQTARFTGEFIPADQSWQQWSIFSGLRTEVESRLKQQSPRQ